MMKHGLIIDDNRQTAEALNSLLRLWDISTRIALMPSTAMAILNENLPDIIFLDVNMPGLNGFEVLAYIKREPRLMRIPVIIITSDDQSETAKRAIQSGAQAIVIKPVMPETLEVALTKANIL
jgi:CheY-like chemotaxis protein